MTAAKNTYRVPTVVGVVRIPVLDVDNRRHHQAVETAETHCEADEQQLPPTQKPLRQGQLLTVGAIELPGITTTVGWRGLVRCRQAVRGQRELVGC